MRNLDRISPFTNQPQRCVQNEALMKKAFASSKAQERICARFLFWSAKQQNAFYLTRNIIDEAR